MSQLNAVEKIEKLIREVNLMKNDIMDIAGTEAENHFKESFDNEGFTDSSLEKWKSVKRTDKNSGWYGFQYKSKQKRPGRKSKKGSITNFSKARTKAPVLSGDTQELMNAITYQRRGWALVFGNPKEYAKIINDGGKMKIFGKHGATMPSRKFMGNSKVLEDQITTVIVEEMKRRRLINK